MSIDYGFARLARLCRILAATALLAGCVTPPPAPPPPEGAPPDFPASSYRPSGDRDRIYAVDAGRSLAQIYVYRGGPLARLGDDHVVSARNLGGFLELESLGGNALHVRADLYAALAGMTVDEEDLLEAAGFSTRSSADDREGTRRNMLASLDAAEFPYVSLSLDTGLTAEFPVDAGFVVVASVTLHGITSTVEVPVDVVADADGLDLSGQFRLAQSDFDIEPFSVMGGALRVSDEIDIRVEIEASRWRDETMTRGDARAVISGR